MENIKEPDVTADEKIVSMIDTWQLPLLRTCCAILGDAELARDAVQETFLKAYRALPDFRGECSEKTWLMHIAVNVCRDMRRNSWFRMVDKRITLDQLPEPSVKPSEDERCLMENILALPAKQREVVILYFYQNMTMTEIAETLKVSQPSLSRRLKRALHKLKIQLEEDAE